MQANKNRSSGIPGKVTVACSAVPSPATQQWILRKAQPLHDSKKPTGHVQRAAVVGHVFPLVVRLQGRWDRPGGAAARRVVSPLALDVAPLVDKLVADSLRPLDPAEVARIVQHTRLRAARVDPFALGFLPVPDESSISFRGGSLLELLVGATGFTTLEDEDVAMVVSTMRHLSTGDLVVATGREGKWTSPDASRAFEVVSPRFGPLWVAAVGRGTRPFVRNRFRAVTGGRRG